MKYMIAPGKSFTTPNCGVVSEYQEVTPKKIGSMFDMLLKSGAIVELSARPDVVHSVNLRPKVKEQFPDRRLQAPSVAEVRKVEVIEPIKKKPMDFRKKEVVEEIKEVEEIPETKLDDSEDLF